MRPPIFTVCKAHAALTALIGTDPVRLYPFGEAPQNVAKPYVVWQVSGGGPENYLGDDADVDGFSTQVDIYATSADSVRAVADAFRGAVAGSAYITGFLGESREPDTKLHRLSLSVDWLTPVP